MAFAIWCRWLAGAMATVAAMAMAGPQRAKRGLRRLARRHDRQSMPRLATPVTRRRRSWGDWCGCPKHPATLRHRDRSGCGRDCPRGQGWAHRAAGEGLAKAGGFWLDPRLRSGEVELLVRRYEKAPAVQLIRWYALRKGGRFEVDYWCDICAVPMYELKTCECCREKSGCGSDRSRKRFVRNAWEGHETGNLAGFFACSTPRQGIT